jgi:hypothetical protein
MDSAVASAVAAVYDYDPGSRSSRTQQEELYRSGRWSRTSGDSSNSSNTPDASSKQPSTTPESTSPVPHVPKRSSAFDRATRALIRHYYEAVFPHALLSRAFRLGERHVVRESAEGLREHLHPRAADANRRPTTLPPVLKDGAALRAMMLTKPYGHDWDVWTTFHWGYVSQDVHLIQRAGKRKDVVCDVPAQEFMVDMDMKDWDVERRPGWRHGILCMCGAKEETKTGVCRRCWVIFRLCDVVLRRLFETAFGPPLWVYSGGKVHAFPCLASIPGAHFPP